MGRVKHERREPGLSQPEGCSQSGTLLEAVGRRVLELRKSRKLSRRELSGRSDISMRYLAQLEAGEGNVSLVLLDRLRKALEVPLVCLLTDHWKDEAELAAFMVAFENAAPLVRRKAVKLITDTGTPGLRKTERICLLGLRGAGKSTLGGQVAEKLGLQFLELNGEIEAAAGMPVDEIIALYGQDGFRRLESETLETIITGEQRVVLAVAGGIVDDPAGFERLLSTCYTIWLKAKPEEHMDRVRKQGDLRPMAGNPQAMVQLREILAKRESSYARADFQLDTSGKTVEKSLSELGDLLREQILFS